MGTVINVGPAGKQTNLSGADVTFEQRALDLAKEQERLEEQEEQERKSPFTSFYQVNKDATKYLIQLADHPIALKILLFIFQNMDNYNALMCSYAVFQEKFGISKATVGRAITRLKENGYIAIVKSGTSNVYIANSDLVWNSWGKNLKYCKFPANVIITESEQETKPKLQINRVKEIILKDETGEIE